MNPNVSPVPHVSRPVRMSHSTPAPIRGRGETNRVKRDQPTTHKNHPRTPARLCVRAGGWGSGITRARVCGGGVGHWLGTFCNAGAAVVPVTCTVVSVRYWCDTSVAGVTWGNAGVGVGW